MQPKIAPDWNYKQQATQLIGAVSSIDFCDASHHNYCVSAGTRLHVYDGTTSAAKRQFTRFKDKVYSGSFRRDGRLIVAGGEDSVVQVFDANSRMLLRQFKGHTAAVHVAKFAADQQHVLTGGDDGLLVLWDITSGQQVFNLCGHADYIRSAANSPANRDLWATSSYDHVCKLWDTRQSRCLMDVDHGAPIESVAFSQTGSLLVTAGGTDICIWHMFGSGQLVHRVAAHQKTVTSVLVVPMAGAQPIVVSAGLDGNIKVFDLENYQPFTVHKYAAPVLSMAASSNFNTLAVGMADGMLSTHRQKQQEEAPEVAQMRWRPQRVVGRLGHSSSLQWAMGAQCGDATSVAQPKVLLPQAGVPQHEELLLKFSFTEALGAALATQRHEVVESVLLFIKLQGALEATLSIASAELVANLIQHVRRQLSNPRLASNGTALAECLLYSCPAAPAGDGLTQEGLQQLGAALAAELRLQEQLMMLLGMTGALLQVI